MDIEFYRNIPAFKDFREITDPKNLFQFPGTWWLILTDIQGSTKAISEGRYKQVNLLGAACITCTMNALGDYEFPFVFGGDGATMLVPDKSKDLVVDELSKLQATALHHFKMSLRIGVIKLQSLYDKGFDLKVGKYEVAPGNFLSQFQGGALTAAEEMLKTDQPGILVLRPAEGNSSPDLTGLSCRISPLKSQNGKILTLLCKPKDRNRSQVILADVLDQFSLILGNNLAVVSPVSRSNISWQWISDSVSQEAKFLGGKLPQVIKYGMVLGGSLLANASLKWGFAMGPFQPGKYKAELILNSDFKKFDETLRMVIDCSENQIIKLKAVLTDMFDKGHIYFGTHVSDSALMTCMVRSASENQHIHFVDGSNGGYAMAAVALKDQMKKALEAKDFA